MVDGNYELEEVGRSRVKKNLRERANDRLAVKSFKPNFAEKDPKMNDIENSLKASAILVQGTSPSVIL